MRRLKNSILKSLLLGFIIMNLTGITYVLGAGIINIDILKKPEKVSTVASKSRDKKEILVKYKDDSKAQTSKDNVKKKLKLNKLNTKKKTKKHKVELLEIDDKDDLTAAVKELKKDPNVESVQPNYKLDAAAVSDPKFAEQWALSNLGQEVSGVQGRSGVDIGAQNAWSITSGSASVVVGVLDAGIDINHEDLKDNIYVNTKEIPGDGIDNDNNGYIDDVNGYDFANKDNNVYDNKTDDKHGTYVAGIIAAASNNKGIVGVAPKVKILPIKFMSGNSGYTCDAIDAIEYAYSMGVKIINCSFGGSDSNPVLEDVMKNSGILFVCAAGNGGINTDNAPVYPACFDMPNIISVTSINNKGMLASFANYGSKIDVAAPGVSILSTTPGNGYEFMSGSSVAVPQVAGIAALLKSQNPNMGAGDIIKRITDNVTKCTSLEGKLATAGRVSAAGALTNVPPSKDTTPAEDSGSVDKPSTGTDPKGGDSLYTMDISLIKEQIHYGESGVNSTTGNFSFTATDMSVESPGFQVNISRTYNSKNNTQGAFGRGWTFGFEGQIIGMTSSLTQVILPNGSVQDFNNSGYVYTADDNKSTLTRNAIDGTFTLKTKDQYSYNFDTNGYLTAMIDRNGNTITITRVNNKITQITDQVGRVFTVAYTGNLISSVTDVAGGRTVTYGYGNGRLTSVTDPANNVMQYDYDAADSTGFLNKVYENNKVGETRSSNLLTSIVYDHTVGNDTGKVRTATDAYGNTYQYNYDTLSKKTTVTDSNGHCTIDWYDEYNYITQTQDYEGKTTITKYFSDASGVNKCGDIQYVIDRNNNKTIYERDSKGNVTKVTNPDLSTREYAYDDKNNIIRQKDEKGNLTFFIYNKIAQTDSNGNVTYTDDLSKKNLQRKVQPLNGTDEYVEGTSQDSKFAITEYSYYTDAENTANSYKAKGLLKSVKDPENHVTSYKYDTYGYANEITDPENKTTKITYDSRGFKVKTESPKPYITTYEYDNNGLLERSTNLFTDASKNEVTRITYDAMGRKKQEISPKQYDASKDNIASHAYNDPAVGTRYQYYYHSKVKNITDAENNVTQYTYDKYGNVETETKANNSVYVYEYDLMNRVKKVSFKEDANAAPVVLEESSYSIMSDNKTLKTYTRYLNSTEKAVSTYIYDYAGRLVQQQNADGGVIKTECNGDGTVASSKDPRGSISYFKYDGLGRLSEQWVPLDTSSGSIKYTYTKTEYYKDGNKSAEKIGVDSVALYGIPAKMISKSYTYYGTDKLKSVTDSAGRRTEYTIDDEGNVSSASEYTNAASINLTEYEYNHLGKVTKKKVHVRKGDLSGNNTADSTDTILETSYIYDKNGNLYSVTTPDNVATTYTYDNLGRQLTSSRSGKDEYGKDVNIVTASAYDWQGKVAATTDAALKPTLYHYSKRGLLDQVTDAKSGVTLYGYDTAGRKILEVSPKNYNASVQPSSMNRVEYEYDSMDRMVKKHDKYVDPDTNQWVDIVSKAVLYDANGNVLKEQDALGFEGGYGTEYTYNLQNKAVTVKDPVTKERGLAYTTLNTYDAAGRKISETNAKGVVTSYYYDDAGNITSVTVKKDSKSAEKTIKEASYDLVGNVLTQKDANKNITVYEYNSLNKLRKRTDPGDATIGSLMTTFQYDNMGNQAVKTDSMGKVNIFTYDHYGRVLSQVEKKSDGTDGISLSYTYDVNGNKRFVTDGNNKVSEYGYDELNRVKTFTTTACGISVNVTHKTTYEYDANGNKTKEIDWRNNTYENVYDPMNRLIQKKDPDQKVIQRIEYYHNSIQARSFDALGKKTEYKYDKNNRLIETIDAENHSTKQNYDDVGNVSSKIDGNTIATSYFYDEFGRLKSVVNAKSETTGFTYDDNGNLLTQTDGKSNIITFVYNAANKVIKRIDPNGDNDPGKKESYTYYPDGNVSTKTDRNGKVTSYVYDIHGRLKSKSIGGDTISYVYDGNGNQLTMTDSTGDTVRKYDELGRVLTKVVPNIGTTEYTYDVTAGLSDGFTEEDSKDPKGNITKKIYDKSGRLKQVKVGDTVTATYDYYDNGSRHSVTYPGGAKEEYNYYDDGLVKTLTNTAASGTVIDTYEYTYDAAHNMKTKKDAKGTTSYDYDSLNRLKKVTEPKGKVTEYGYDAAGNRLTESVTSGGSITVTTYYYNDQNRLLKTVAEGSGTTETVTFTYDNNGNMLTSTKEKVGAVDPSQVASTTAFKAGTSKDSGVVFYKYDVWNQMVRSIAGDKTTTMKYNGEGLRVEKTVNGDTTRYLYEYDNVVLEVDAAGNQKARNVYGLNLLQRIAGSDSYYYMYNGHADVTALLNTNGTMAATYYYDAFGNIIETTGTANNSITYAGYQYDSETGLYYCNSRMYDPRIARFMQEDTYAGDPNDPLSLNLYTYCQNEPLMYDDPTGHVLATVGGQYIGNAQIKNGVTTGNMRDIMEGLGGYVDWDGSTSTATVSIKGKVVTYKLKEMVDGVGKATDGTTFTVLNGNKIQIELKSTAQKYGATVNYSSNYKSSSVIASVTDEQVLINMGADHYTDFGKKALIDAYHDNIRKPVVSIVDGRISYMKQSDINAGKGDYGTYWFDAYGNIPVVSKADWKHSTVKGVDLSSVYNEGYWINPMTQINVWSTTTSGVKSSYLAKDMATDFDKANWSLTEPYIPSYEGTGNAYTPSGSRIEEKIWNYLTQYRGLSEIAAAGVMGNIEKESGLDPFLVEAGGGGGWGLIQWTPAKNIEIAAPKKGMSAGATSGNVDDYLLWELDAIWQRGLDRGGKSFWTNMNLETSVGSYTSPPTAKSAGGTQFNGNYKGSGSAYYFHAVVEGSGDMNFGLDAKGVPKGSQKYNGSWHGNILLRPYYAEQILAKYK